MGAVGSLALWGKLCGLSTSVLWTVTALFFHAATKRLGPTLVNVTRILFAVVFLAIAHRLLNGVWIPDARMGQVACLAASGVIGLSLGDQALLTAYVDIGPRLAMLVMTTAPVFAALLGLVFLGERLSAISLVGMAITISGIVWVVMERPSGPVSLDRRRRIRGVILAVVAGLCQASGLLLSKRGMGHGWLAPEEFLRPQSATLVRMVFGALGMIPALTVYLFRERELRRVGVNPPRFGTRWGGVFFAACGAVTGPFLGVWMSLEASNALPLGVAQTLCSLAPILVVPSVALVERERVSMRAALGAGLAVTGTAVLFL